MVAHPILEWASPFQTEVTCHVTPSALPLFSLAARSVQTCFCSSGKLFGQIYNLVEIGVLLFSDLFYNDSKDLLNIFHGVFSCGLLVHDGETM